MSLTEPLKEMLEEHGVDYEVLEHPTAFTAQEEAAATHVSGRNWAKTVAVRIGGDPALVVLPATRQVDLDRLAEVTGADAVELLPEEEMEEIYPDCEVGAMPPFGPLYGQRTFVDESLREDEFVVFHAGDHETAVRISYPAFEELADPIPAAFSEPSEP